MNDQASSAANQPSQTSPAPPVAPPPVVPAGDATGGLIPYTNPPALIAYYLGIFSFIPVLGAALGLTALSLGIVGLQKASRFPQVRGQAHAWIGIIVGGVFGLANLGLVIVIATGALVS